MKPIKSSLLFVFSLVVVSSCFDPPEFPNTPKLFPASEFYFREKRTVNEVDSLFVVVPFQDGDGDLGLGDVNTSQDIEPPFHDLDFFLDTSGKIATSRSTEIVYNSESHFFPYTISATVPKVLLSSQPSRFTGRPATKNIQGVTNPCNLFTASSIAGQNVKGIFVPAELVDKTYNIVDSASINQHKFYLVDETFYVESNPYHNNIEVTFWVLRLGGNIENHDHYDEFDWNNIRPGECGDADGYNGRFPVLAENGKRSPLEGKIKYAMVGARFRETFGNNIIKLRIKIRDRALNESNEIETQPRTLNELKR